MRGQIMIHHKKKMLVAWLLLFVIFATSSSFSQQIEAISSFNAHKYINQKKTVCGKVASTFFAQRSRGKPTFLNLDKPYPNHIFTAVIWINDRGKFEGPPEILFKDRAICVVGRITVFRGKPQIVVKDPSQIN
jgi:hypothetical protein